MKFSVFLLMILLSSTIFAETSDKCPGEEGYYYTNYRHTNNPQNGGFVSYTATIEDNTRIVIGKMAAVCGNAIILGSPNISGNVIVRGNAEVSDSSIITGDVILEGDVVVKGKSIIKGRGTLSTGVFEDARHEVTPPAKILLAEKISKYFSSGNLNVVGPDGAYHTQSIEFTGDPCQDQVKLRTSNDLASSIQEFSLSSATDFRYSIGNIYISPPSIQFTVAVKFTSFRPDGSVWHRENFNIGTINVNNKAQYDLVLPMFEELIKACRI